VKPVALAEARLAVGQPTVHRTSYMAVARRFSRSAPRRELPWTGTNETRTGTTRSPPCSIAASFPSSRGKARVVNAAAPGSSTPVSAPATPSMPRS